MKTVYVVTEKGSEYDDEYYYIHDKGHNHQNKAFESRADADKLCSELTNSFAVENDPSEYYYICECMTEEESAACWCTYGGEITDNVKAARIAVWNKYVVKTFVVEELTIE